MTNIDAGVFQFGVRESERRSAPGFSMKPPAKCMFNRCDWPYEGFHICVDLSTPEVVKVRVKNQPSDEAREAARIAVRIRWDREKSSPEYIEKNKTLVRRYVEEGISIKLLAKAEGVGQKRVRVALEEAGVDTRPPGTNRKYRK